MYIVVVYIDLGLNQYISEPILTVESVNIKTKANKWQFHVEVPVGNICM